MTDTVATPTAPTTTAEVVTTTIAPTTPVVTPPVAPTTQYVNVPNYAGATPIDTAINVFAQGASVDVGKFNTVIENALSYGDANLIDYATLTQGLNPDQAAQAKALVLSVYEQKVQQAQAVTQQAQETVYQLAGNKEAWDAASAAFNTNASAHLKVAVSGLLESGHIKEAAQLVLDIARGTGMVNTVQGTPQVQGGVGGVQQGISQEEYFAEIHKLNAQSGNRSFSQGSNAVALKQLTARRELGRNQGL